MSINCNSNDHCHPKSNVASWKLLGAMLLALSSQGCTQDETRNPLRRELNHFGGAMCWFFEESKMTPWSFEEMGLDRKELPILSRRIDDGSFIVIWNASFKEGETTRDGHVFGYERDAPSKGGYVLKYGGVVEKVTAEEFNRLPQIPVVSVPSELEWNRYQCDDKRFSAEFPVKPKTAPSGIAFQWDRLRARLPFGKGLFVIEVLGVPDEVQGENNDVILDYFREQCLEQKAWKQKLISDKSITHEGAVGREIQLELGQSHVVLHQFFVFSDVVFRSTVVVESAFMNSPDVIRFLDSIRFEDVES